MNNSKTNNLFHSIHQIGTIFIQQMYLCMLNPITFQE